MIIRLVSRIIAALGRESRPSWVVGVGSSAHLAYTVEGVTYLTDGRVYAVRGAA